MYKIISHTGDIGLYISSSSLSELFGEAFYGFCKIVFNNAGTHTHTDDIEVALTAESKEELLVSWLNELNYFIVTERFFIADYAHLKVLEGNGFYSLKCMLQVSSLTERLIELITEIKAVTYHKLKIVETDEVFSTTLIFDL